jgi:Uma2 family endonuclease
VQHAIVSRVDEQDYLEGEKLAKVRHEYVAGEVFAMAGASKAHGSIALNVGAALRNHLRGKPCRAYIADMKVRVKQDSAYYYPDVVVTCAARDLAADAPAHYLDAPNLIVEVLSDATERIDRSEKLRAYQQLDSLVEYVIINQDKRELEIHRRTPTGWQRDILERGDICQLQSVAIDLSLDQIYEDSGIA